MAVEQHQWKDVDEETLLEWGNFSATIHKPEPHPGPEKVMLLAWAETANGSLTLSRQVKVDLRGGVFIPVQFRTIAKDAWASIEIDGFSFDLEKLEEQLDARDEAIRQAEAAHKLGLAHPGGVVPIGGPNREQRRHPG